MKRILLPAAAMAFLALMLGGCTMDGDKIVVTDPPRVTSNVTSSPAPVTPEVPAVTPDAPGAGSVPDQSGGLTSGKGIDQGSGPNDTGAKHSAVPGTTGK
jgi:hypothetical protein